MQININIAYYAIEEETNGKCQRQKRTKPYRYLVLILKFHTQFTLYLYKQIAINFDSISVEPFFQVKW